MCNSGLMKLRGVMGYKGRRNDVIYCPPKVKSDVTQTVVFFGGDIQDFLENMSNQQYMKWNLDSTATDLQSRFPQSHIVVVRPAKIELKMFSCFDNFVPGNDCGVPEHTPTHYALHHLELLLKCIGERVGTTFEADEPEMPANGQIQPIKPSEWWSRDLELEKSNLSLIGFSKGCVVLNQFIYEFHYLKTLTPEDELLSTFVSRITDMYWLDGGHSGSKNVWITSTSLLETLARLGIKIHVHVTPYQVRNEQRSWIGNEHKLFVERLKKAGAEVEEKIHFENEPPVVLRHFQVLSVFCA